MFEVGQKVVWLRNGCVFGDKKIITKIIAKTEIRGHFKVTGCPSKFDADGVEVKKGFLRDYIVPVTKELEEEIAHTNVSRRLNEFNFSKLTLAQLREIVGTMVKVGIST